MSVAGAYRILEDSIVHYQVRPVGTAAAINPNPAAANYHECFVRDFVPSALVFLLNDRPEIVRNFLLRVRDLRGQQSVLEGHSRARGLMPASFKVIAKNGGERLDADFGDRANFYQAWSATGLMLAQEIMEHPERRALFDRSDFREPLEPAAET